MANLVEKIQEFIEAEIKKELLKYAQLISKKHDISLKLLIQDISTKYEPSETNSEQCMGITAKKTQCKSSGKHGGGYCKRHIDQKKKVTLPKVFSSGDVHVGHTIKECMFLAGCPACEKSRTRGTSQQNLLIDI